MQYLIVDETKKGSNTGFPNTIHGFFFTEKKENATLFGKRIIKASIVIEKAIDLTIHGIFSEKDQAPLIWKILTGEVLSEEDALTQLDENISLGEIDELYDALNSEESHHSLKEAGYDGIISSLGNDEIEYIVFTTEQINLKIGKLTHQGIGQMHMYVNYHDRRIKLPEENSTIGVILLQRREQSSG